MHALAEKYLRKGSLPTLFCPGCGHGTVLNCFVRVIDDLGIIDRLGLVSGIGCSSWVPVFVNADVLHTLHGRAIAVATGLKLGNPGLHVVVFTGDGDCMGIGGNHFIHAARRNIDITVIMLDNYIYGMTGGQVAPTTPTDSRTQTSPYGNPEPPIDACKLAIVSGATYVARCTTAQPAALAKAMKEAIRHKGFSFIDTISQCPTQAGRNIFATDDPAELLRVLKTKTISRAKAETLSENERQDRIVTGKLFEDKQKQEFVTKIYSLIETAKG
jgi:2-oxoglutarate ferredoxin oxidoreductase subunit beta